MPMDHRRPPKVEAGRGRSVPGRGKCPQLWKPVLHNGQNVDNPAFGVNNEKALSVGMRRKNNLAEIAVDKWGDVQQLARL